MNGPVEIKKGGVAADEILARISNLSDRSVGTKEKLLTKLNTVMSSQAVTTDGSYPIAAERDYPPLFDAIRKNLVTIEQSMLVIEDAIDRTEL